MDKRLQKKIYYSADSNKAYMGLYNFKGEQPNQQEVLIAKNYCNEEEILALNSIVSTYLEFAEMQARRRIPMYMSDWVETLDGFLKLSKYDVLTHAGKISSKVAENRAKTEYAKYSSLYLDDISKVENDFVKMLEDMEKKLIGK